LMAQSSETPGECASDFPRADDADSHISTLC
jgi:hypothetical protein